MRKRIVAIAGAVLVGVAALTVGAKPTYAPKNTSPPAVTGTTTVGSLLSCSTGSWTRSPSSYTYAWQNSPDGTTWSVIGSAASSTYTLLEGDSTKTVRCKVNALKGTTSGEAFSSAVGPITGGGGGGGDTANLWIDTDGGTCTRSALAAYSSASACATFDAAYDAASGGDTVAVKAGTYDPQGITGSKASLVTFLPATGETVNVGGWSHLGTTTTYVIGSSYTLGLQASETTTGYPSTNSCPDTGAGTCYKLYVGISRFECTGKTGSTFTGCKAVTSGGLSPLKYYDGADIQPYDPTTVTATNVEFRDLSINDISVSNPANGVTFRRNTGHRWYVDGTANNINFVGGTYGNTTSGLVNSAGRSGVPTNVTIDGVTFQNIDARDAGGAVPNDAHGECIHWGAGTTITIKNSTFKGCAVYNISFFNLGGAGIATGVLVENNFFDCPWNQATPGNGVAPIRCGAGGASLSVNNTTAAAVTYTIRYNSFADNSSMVFELGGSGSFTGTTVIGNLGNRAYNLCNFSGVSCSYNVWDRTFDCPGSNETNATCSTDASAQYVSDATVNLHLVNGSAAETKGSPSVCPAADIDVQARPQPGATTCDAGADERD
jgi:hypothetical protein